MTDTDIHIAVAKIDGITQCDPKMFESSDLFHKKGKGFLLRKDIPDYLNSYNAIISVIKGLSEGKMASSNPGDYPRWMFSSFLLKEIGINLWINASALNVPYDIGWLIITATPKQLCIALLKALEQYKEDEQQKIQVDKL